MAQRALVCVVAVIALAASFPLAAQSDDSVAERERALARDLAAEQEASAEQERALRGLEAQRELVAQQQEQQRTLQREFQEQQRELAAQQRQQAAQQAEEQRALARQFEAQQRELAAQYTEQNRVYAEELQRAQTQLAAAAAQIAELSAQRWQPVLNNARYRLSTLGQRAMLGIGIEDSDGGVRVTSVSPNGPAAATGVAVGDKIVAINGFELGGSEANRVEAPAAAFLARLGELAPGDDVELRLTRGGNSRFVVVRATENNNSFFGFEPYREFLAQANGLRVGPGDFMAMIRGPWSDVELVPLTPSLGEYFATETGLLVVRAGRMGELGLRDGDVILELGGRQPQSPEHAMRILGSFEPGESLPMSIMRQRRREALELTVPAAPQARVPPQPGRSN